MYSIDPTFREAKHDPISLVMSAEKSYEDQINTLIAHIPSSVRFLALAGPSCSGKTTTAHRLINAFERVGRKVFVLSLDDFFKGIENAPLDDEGNPDLDHIDLIDHDLLQKVLKGFCTNDFVEIPTFNFVLRARDEKWRRINSADYDLCIVEGLHALHPRFNNLIPQDYLFSLYVSVTEDYRIGDEPFLSMLEIRLLRRMVRDYYCRGATIPYTYHLWRNVLRGENRFIYPSINRADWKLSSNFITEPHFMAHDALPLLSVIDKGEKVFPTAKLLCEKLERIPPLSPDLLPGDSLLREFFGHR